jgi:integrase
MARKKPEPKPKRRGRDTGAIRHRPTRAEPWEAAWQHEGGQWEYRSFPHRSQAAEWLDSLVAKRAAGNDTAAGGRTFAAFIAGWLDAKEITIAPKTTYTYRYYCELASGQFGTVKIDLLTLEHMQALLKYLVRAKFQNIAQLFAVLRQAFKYARSSSLRWMTVDPLDGLELPRTQRKVTKVLTKRQRADLLTLAEADDPACPLLPLWHVYSRLALRLGEGVALRWTDIDWEEKILTVDETTARFGGQTHTGQTKGRKTRYAPIPDDVLELLRQHRAAQQKRGLFPHVFTYADGSQVKPAHVQHRLGKLAQAAGVTVTVHGLRHTALTLLALDGTPQNALMALAGHLSPDISRLYTNHATAEDVRRWVG